MYAAGKPKCNLVVQSGTFRNGEICTRVVAAAAGPPDHLAPPMLFRKVMAPYNASQEAPQQLFRRRARNAEAKESVGR